MKAIKITIILEQPNFDPYSEEIARELLGSQHCFGVYRSFKQDNVTFEETDLYPGNINFNDKGSRSFSNKK